MGITKKEDIIFWIDKEGDLYCNECAGAYPEAKPVTLLDTESHGDDDSFVECDECEKVIRR